MQFQGHFQTFLGISHAILLASFSTNSFWRRSASVCFSSAICARGAFDDPSGPLAVQRHHDNFDGSFAWDDRVALPFRGVRFQSTM